MCNISANNAENTVFFRRGIKLENTNILMDPVAKVHVGTNMQIGSEGDFAEELWQAWEKIDK